jgi:hypothetical protein
LLERSKKCAELSKSGHRPRKMPRKRTGKLGSKAKAGYEFQLSWQDNECSHCLRSPLRLRNLSSRPPLKGSGV